MKIIQLTRDSSLWQDFYGLPSQVYENDPFYIRPSEVSVRKGVERPDFKDSQLPLLVIDKGKPQVRLIVRVSENLARDDEGKVGLFSFFEAHNCWDAVEMLFQKGINWLKEQGIFRVIGPMDGDTWHKYRLNVGPFNRPPFMMEPYNPPYYAELWERFGFRLFSSYYSKFVPDVETILPGMERFYQRTLKNGFTYRKFRLNDFENELKILYKLSCEIFADNYLYTPISFDEFKVLYIDARTIINENLVWFTLDKQGKYCGFVFSYPDYSHALRSMRGKRNLLAKLKFMINRRRADTLNIKTVGTIPQYRGLGLGSALMYKAYNEGFRLGYQKANMCLIHQENPSGKFDGGKGEILRSYHLYEYRF